MLAESPSLGLSAVWTATLVECWGLTANGKKLPKVPSSRKCHGFTYDTYQLSNQGTPRYLRLSPNRCSLMALSGCKTVRG